MPENVLEKIIKKKIEKIEDSKKSILDKTIIRKLTGSSGHASFEEKFKLYNFGFIEKTCFL